MAINVYTGLQGSGKSFEVVARVIVPAIAAGRNVVSNIDGLDNEAIRAYASEKLGTPLDKCGIVIPVNDEEIRIKEFFPVNPSVQSIVSPGDLVCIDEAWKFWPTDSKISNEHRTFFREHRHYINPATGVACDLVLMVQDISDLHRMLKVVVQLTFRCHKAKGLGLNKVYTVKMWEGTRLTEKLVGKDWTRTYDAEIFPLYKSYSGEQGKEKDPDSRHNIMTGGLKLKLVLYVLVLGFAVWWVWDWWSSKLSPVDAVPVPSSALSTVGSKPAVPVPASSDWRIVGMVETDGLYQVLVSDGVSLRLLPASDFKGRGLGMSGFFDGRPVNAWTFPNPEKKQGLL